MKLNSFSTAFLEKASQRRSNKSWIESILKEKTTRLIPIFESKVLVSNDDNKPIFITQNNLANISDINDLMIFLGINDGRAYFAYNIPYKFQASTISRNQNGKFIDLKRVRHYLKYQDIILLSLAKFMVYWNLRNSFCGHCGNRTISMEAGNLRICENPSCSTKYFPNMDPAIIVLVSSGKSCLLGRQSFWPKRIYSTIAGFVEPGETIEEAVYREVLEETGIKTKEITYYSSQPWLFPNSLMLGFWAKTANKEIRIDDNELEKACWFTREEIKKRLINKSLKLPSRSSIAYNLIKTWFEEDGIYRLSKI